MSRSLLSRTPLKADHRVPFGTDASQFGDLWLPAGAAGAKAPVVVFLHGGWWRAEFGLEYGSHLCAALKREGIACWSLEYRRVGQPGGGWPGTFEDVAFGYGFLRVLAGMYPLDLDRVVVVGHSAGGHLAFWLAGRPHLPESGPLQPPGQMLAMRGVVGLAAVVDLRMTIDLAEGVFRTARQQVVDLMQATPAQAPERYRAGNPGDLLPLHVPQVLLQGSLDGQIPPQLPERWTARGHRIGETVAFERILNADHFDVADPESKAWPQVRDAIKRLLL